MPEYTDSGPSAEYPLRPDHPHFRLIANLCQDIDGDSGVRDSGPLAFAEDEQVDPASLNYAAVQRALRAELAGEAAMVSTPVVLQAAWMDGFALGYLFAVNRPDLP